jgi:hypothetical protein
MTNFNLNAKETIEKLSQLNVWHKIQNYDYYTLIGIEGKGGNNFYWFKVFNGDDTLFFDHCYNWANGKTSKNSQKWNTAYNTINRLINK